MRNYFDKLGRLLEDWVWGIRIFLQRHLGAHGDLKVLSVIISAGLFIFIRSTIGYSETYRAPVHLSITEEGVAILQYSPMEVEVELKGPAEEIRSFDATKLKVQKTIDSTREKSKEVIELSRRSVLGAGKLRVVRILPPEVFVEYDREMEVTMRLSSPELTGRALQGEAAVVLLPGTVQVIGSENQLMKLVEKGILLPTESVDVSGRTQGFVRRVKVLPPDDSGISKVIPDEVDARITITIQAPAESVYTNALIPTATNRLPIISRPEVTNQADHETLEAPVSEASEAPVSELGGAALPEAD